MEVHGLCIRIFITSSGVGLNWQGLNLLVEEG